MDVEIVSQKFCNKCKTFKLLSNFHKCSRNKSGRQSKCVSCMNNYYMENQEKLIARSRLWEKENAAQKNLTQKVWVKNNQDKRNKSISDYYKNNKEKALKASKAWKANNPHKLTSYAAKRRAQLRNAQPKWADLTKIEIEYKLAAWCTEVMGEPYHVDHIIPLTNKKVCGLHVHNNLRVMRGIENIRKSNKFIIK